VAIGSDGRELNCASREQVFRQFPKLTRHFHGTIRFNVVAVTHQQLKFRVTKITGSQVNFDLSSICNWQMVTVVTK